MQRDGKLGVYKLRTVQYVNKWTVCVNIPVMSPLGSLGGRQLTLTVPDTLWLIDTVTDRGAELGAVTAASQLGIERVQACTR